MTLKTASELNVGDKVKRDTGEMVTITHKGRGMILGATLVEWNGGGADKWGHLFKGDAVEVVDTRA